MMLPFAQIRQALLLGLAGNPLPAVTGSALDTVSLLAEWSRFTRPASPPMATAIQRKTAVSETSLVPEAARPTLLKLLGAKDSNPSDTIARAVAHALARRKLRLHPFDYSRLEPFIARNAEWLGPEARAWLAAVNPEQSKEQPYDAEPVTEETLAIAGKPQKLAFLRDLRQRDPCKARALIQALLPNEAANMRADLIELLGLGLDEDDRPFIEALASDRAQSVRDRAEMLLARIPGTEAYRKKLQLARDNIEKKKAGWLRRRIVLALRIEQRPAVTHVDPQYYAVVEKAEIFQGLRLSDLAATLGLGVDEMLAAAAESPGLGHLLLKRAIDEGRAVDLDAFGSLLSGDTSSGMRSSLFFLEHILPNASANMRRQILGFVISPENWPEMPAPYDLERIYELLRQPLPHDLAASVLASKPWQEALGGQESTKYLVEAAAPLIPRSLSDAFLRDAEPHSHRAVLYHRFLNALPEEESL